MYNVLVIAPHPDDAELGLGGTIAQHVQNGDNVTVALLATQNWRNLPYEPDDQKQTPIALENAKTAQQVLGYQKLIMCNLDDQTLDGLVIDILDHLEPVYEDCKPDILYVTHYGDNNQDHRAAFEAAQVLARPMRDNPVKRFVCYETPSSTDQSPQVQHLVFTPNRYTILSNDLMEIKKKAFAAYASELRDEPHPRSEYGLEIYARFRGMAINTKYAEALHVLRDFL